MAAWAALWRDDATRFAAAVTSQCRAEKDLCCLAAAALKHSSRLGFGSIAEETEMAAAAPCSWTSAAVFMAAVFMSLPRHPPARRRQRLWPSTRRPRRRRTRWLLSLGRFEALEQCIDESNSSYSNVFRSILQTRVALLNIQTRIGTWKQCIPPKEILFQPGDDWSYFLLMIGVLDYQWLLFTDD